jgi:hypothetical protein
MMFLLLEEFQKMAIYEKGDILYTITSPLAQRFTPQDSSQSLILGIRLPPLMRK